MQERKGIITFQGNPLTLVGPEIKVKQAAPDFEILSGDLKKLTLKDFCGKVKVICTVPSLDTPVCDFEIKRFNEEAVKFSKKIVVLFVSMDLPFAQSRFCQNFRVDHVSTFSDHAWASLGLAYGVLIKELRLLTRAIFIVDDQDVVCYVDYVKEITQQPNFTKALEVIRAFV